MADGFSDNGAPLGVPYKGAVVTPEVPVADHTAAKIIASADIAGHFTAGLAAMGQIAAANKRAQLEAEQMATDAALKSRQLDIAREDNLLDYQVGLNGAESEAEYRRNMAQAALKNAGTRAQVVNRQIEDKAASERNLLSYATRIQSEIADYKSEKEKFGLNDPHPKDVRDFVGKHVQLAYNFQNADIPFIKSDIQTLNARSKKLQGEIPLRYGAINEEGEWKGGVTKAFTPAEIIEGLSRKETEGLFADALEASGLLTARPHDFTAGERGVKGGATVSGKLSSAPQWLTDWQKGIPTPAGEPRPSVARMSQWMAKRTPSETVETAPGQPSIPQGAVDEAAATMATEAGASVSTPPNVFDTSEVDTLLGDYKRFKGQPGFKDAKARQFLIDKYKVDPEAQ